jgi:GntR family transcriptional regulator
MARSKTKKLKFSGPVPLYVQIANILRQRISRGDWQPGDALPSEAELAASFGVTRLTLRQATATLVSEGLLLRRRGKRTEITASSRQGGVQARRLTGSLHADYRGLGETTRFKVIDRVFERASPEVSSKLKVTAGQEVFHIERVLHDRTDPLACLQTWLPADIGRLVLHDNLEDSTLLSVLREAHRIRASNSEQIIVATIADVHLAERLDISVGAPVLRVKALYATTSGRPINYTFLDYRADRFEYTVTLR